ILDLATLLDIDPDNRLLIFSVIDKDKRSEVIDAVNSHTLRQLTGHMSEHDLAQLIESSPSIISQKIASTVDRSRLDRLIPIIVDEGRRHHLQQFANYPKRSVGRIMQTELVSVNIEDKVETALKTVEEFDSFAVPIYQVYVLNKKDEFVGTI